MNRNCCCALIVSLRCANNSAGTTCATSLVDQTGRRQINASSFSIRVIGVVELKVFSGGTFSGYFQEDGVPVSGQSQPYNSYQLIVERLVAGVYVVIKVYTLNRCAGAGTPGGFCNGQVVVIDYIKNLTITPGDYISLKANSQDRSMFQNPNIVVVRNPPIPNGPIGSPTNQPFYGQWCRVEVSLPIVPP